MFLRAKIVLTITIVGMIMVAWIVPANAAGFYEGKTITLLIPVPGGSGMDIAARTFAKYWQKHIPGNPTIIPKNMPGAGGAQALNFLAEKSKPDGLTVFWGYWNAAGIISGQEGLRYVPEKFGYIGASGGYRTTIIRTDISPGIKNAADIAKAETFNVGGRRTDMALDLIGNLGFEMIGAKYRFISGFKGMAKIFPAMQRNEVQACNSGHTGYHTFFKDAMVKEEKAMALYYHPNFDIQGNPIERTDAFPPSVKGFHEVYEEVHGKMPSGELWEAYKWYSTVVASMDHTVFMTPGSPKEAMEELRKSYQATSKDQEYLMPSIERYGAGQRFLSTEEGLKIMSEFRKVSPGVLEVLEKMTTIDRK